MKPIRVLVFAMEFGKNASTESALYNQYLKLTKIASLLILVVWNNTENKIFKNLKIVKVPFPYKPFWTLRNTLAFTKSMIQNRNNFDIVFSKMFGPHILIPSILAKLLFRKRFVLFIPGNHQIYRNKENRNLRIIMKIALMFADKIGTFSPSILDEFEYHMKKIDRKKIFYILNPVDCKKFKPNEQDMYENTILSVGRIASVKNHEMLINAIPFIVKEFPDIKIKIIGAIQDEVYYNKIKELAKNTRCEKNIEFVGKIDHEQLPNWYNSCKIFVLTSRSEGIPNSLLEAMACGKPFISTAVGGIPDIVKDKINGMFVEIDHYEELAKKINSLLKNTKERNEMGKRNREMIEKKFSEEVFIDEFKTVFTQVVSK